MIGRGRLKRVYEPITEKEIAESVLEKLILALRERFHNFIRVPLTVNDLLLKLDETITNASKVILDGLVENCPRIRITEQRELEYIPPLEIKTTDDLLRIIQDNSKRCEGVLEDDVLDSYPIGTSMIEFLESTGKIFSVLREDGKKVIFSTSLKEDTEVSVDEQMKNYYHSISVRDIFNIDIESYLVRNKIKPLASGKPHPTFISSIKNLRKKKILGALALLRQSKTSHVQKKKKRTRNLKCNAHMTAEIKHYTS